jgi:hypothetical protein
MPSPRSPGERGAWFCCLFTMRPGCNAGRHMMMKSYALQGASRGATVVAYAAAAAALQAAWCGGACAAQHLQTGAVGQLP